MRAILVWTALGCAPAAFVAADAFHALAPSEEAAFGAVPLEELQPAGFTLFALPPASASPVPAAAVAIPGTGRLCMLFQCRTLPIAPAPKLFTKGVTIWTAAALLGGFADGIQGPAHYGFGDFHFTNEGFFETWTYGGGADKASHFVISATISGMLYDAYRLNGLSPDQSFWLSLGTTIVAGTLVEIGDGLTPYGFSAQDLAADTLGGLTEAVLKRTGTDDLFGFRIGKVPTTIPPAVLGDRTGTLGLDYTNEIYTADMKFDGLLKRASAPPGIGRFFLTSFVFMTKGYGYAPPIPSRYQEIGLEVGLNFPEILRAVGVSRETWWGDLILRAFEFFRIPYTQIGAYYNLTNRKWYGPGAPYHYY
ncbi:MAG: DUF2279 domain-containing protein [Syntrophomonadaceae bacterium]